MIKLYRGIVDILVTQSRDMGVQVSKHIRGNLTNKDVEESETGSTGIWNLLLEVIFLVFGQLIFLVGLSIVASFAIVFFPMQAVWRAFMDMTNFRTSYNNIGENKPVCVEPKLDKNTTQA